AGLRVGARAAGGGAAVARRPLRAQRPERAGAVRGGVLPRRARRRGSSAAAGEDGVDPVTGQSSRLDLFSTSFKASLAGGGLSSKERKRSRSRSDSGDATSSAKR